MTAAAARCSCARGSYAFAIFVGFWDTEESGDDGNDEERGSN